VVLCPQVAAVQAQQHGQSTQAELELLTVHGVLHLLGYDHADPEEEAEMFGLQNELLRDWRLESAGRAPSAAPAPADPSSADPAAQPASAEQATADPAAAGQASAEPPATTQPAADDKAAGPSESGEGPEGPALCPPPPGCWSSPSC
jgi:hypothetical protein